MLEIRQATQPDEQGQPTILYQDVNVYGLPVYDSPSFKPRRKPAKNSANEMDGLGIAGLSDTLLGVLLETISILNDNLPRETAWHLMERDSMDCPDALQGGGYVRYILKREGYGYCSSSTSRKGMLRRILPLPYNPIGSKMSSIQEIKPMRGEDQKTWTDISDSDSDTGMNTPLGDTGLQYMMPRPREFDNPEALCHYCQKVSRQRNFCLAIGLLCIFLVWWLA